MWLLKWCSLVGVKVRSEHACSPCNDVAYKMSEHVDMWPWFAWNTDGTLRIFPPGLWLYTTDMTWWLLFRWLHSVKGDISSYNGRWVQDKGRKVTIYGDTDVPFKSQYHSVNWTMILFWNTSSILLYVRHLWTNEGRRSGTADNDCVY